MPLYERLSSFVSHNIHDIILISSALMLLVCMAGCGAVRQAGSTLPDEILAYTHTGISFGDAAIAKQYTFITDAYELGLMNEATFLERRGRLDRAESVLADITETAALLARAIAEKTSIGGLVAVLAESTLLLNARLEGAGVPLPEQWVTFVTLVGSFGTPLAEASE